MSTVLRGLIGVVHLQAMPGDPAYREGGFQAVERAALADAEALARGGADALIVENFGSAPFPKSTEGNRLPPHQVAFLALVVRECLRRTGLPVGVNCLRNDTISALGIAAATGASFVRINVHTGAYVTDQGLIEGEADRSLRYRLALGARIELAADVLVKHAAPLAPLGPVEAVQDCFDRGLADGVVISGIATGAPVDEALLRQAREAAGSRPVLLGSGLTPERADTLAPLATGAIVGTWLKVDGKVRAPVDEERVRRLAAAVKGRFLPPG
ncbi:MAG: BtpA/SgcQ family protein [Myxococcales bacterium]|nr:BtpA/SgcQ family protein [Polyangiaceae bacterium]MDW8249743.1 BtpA/SgcQ family protein [Myxococcales bacterium]